MRQVPFLALAAFLAAPCPAAWAADAVPSVDIPRLDSAPRLDGVLDDPAWAKAARVSGLMQFQPKEGIPMSEDTEAFLGYDEDNLFVAFDARDSEPARVRAQLLPRDKAFEDDWVMIILDTFGDQRRAYELLSNPLGVQGDLFSQGGNEDLAPDFVWHSAGRTHERGYTVEMRIPFKSLRFDPTSPRPWRLYLARNIQRKNEKGLWPEFQTSRGSLLSQTGELHGLSGIRPGRRLEIIPELTGGRVIPADPQGDSFHAGPWDVRAGVNARYGLTPNWTLDSAFNPDFSQVEADQPQIQVNQRFPLFFAEKRPFFMEGADLFSTPFQLVHTRTLVDPQHGLKLTGKQGAYSAGLLSSRDRALGGASVHIARLNRDVGEESTVGLLFAGRETGSGFHNRVAALDGRFRLGKLYSLGWQGAESLTRDGSGRKDSPAYKLSLGRQSRYLGFALSYLDVGPRFQADTGFIRRADIRQGGMDLWRNVYPEAGPLIQWKPYTGYWRTHDHSGIETDEEYYFGLYLGFPLQTYLDLSLSPDVLERFGGEDFRKRRMSFSAGMQPARFLAASLSTSLGDQIDYASVPPRLGDGWETSASLTLKPSARLELRQLYLKSRLDTKAGERAFDENVWRTRLTFQATKELSARLIYQYTTLGHGGFADLLLSYVLTPGTSAHAGYDVSFARNPNAWETTREVFFTKLSWLFRI